MSEIDNLLPALEALIFASEEPASPTSIRRVFKELTPAKLGEAVRAINTQLDKDGRPYQIAEVAGGYQFRTRREYGEVLRAAQPERKVRLSRAALESLAVIAYKQPLTRAELEELRSVDCGAIMKSLMERDLVRIMGRRDAPGRPVLYGTTSSFLEMFGLSALGDLPSLREIETMAEDHGIATAEASQHGSGAREDLDGQAGEAASDATEQDDESEIALEAAPSGGDEGADDESSDWSEEDWPEEEDASV